MLVLHGGPGFDQGYLRPGLGTLRGDAQLVFVDLRGQGRSARVPAETCTLEQMADDAAELCARLGISEPVVFGHSAGGFVALHLALRHPAVPSRLILCDTVPTLAPMPDDNPPPGLAERSSAEAANVAARLFGGDFSAETMSAFGQLVAPYYAGPQHQEVPGRLLSLSGFAADVARLRRAATPSGHLHADPWDRRPVRLAVPTCGQPGPGTGIPGAELAEIAGAGHFVFSEEPPVFQHIVRDFLPPPATAPPPGQPPAAAPATTV
jgi:proline iminopeptidase